MFLHLDFLWPDDASDDTVLVCKESGAEYAHGHLAIHFLLSIYAEFRNQSFLCIADERERQVVLLDEFLVALGILGFLVQCCRFILACPFIFWLDSVHHYCLSLSNVGYSSGNSMDTSMRPATSPPGSSNQGVWCSRRCLPCLIIS